MKKFKLGMLTCVTVAAISTVSLGATGKVNTDTARIRSEASSESTIVELLSIDDKVEVLDETGDWYKIKVGEKDGYISKSLLDVEGDINKKETKTEETSTNKVEQTENTTEGKTEESVNNNVEGTTEESKVEEIAQKDEKKVKENFVGKLSSEVTIKILPSINSTNIAKIEKDAEIKITEIINDWCHLETSKFSGWTRVNIVENAIADNNEQEETVTTEEEQQEEIVTETKTGYVNVESVNIRKEKNTSSEILTKLTMNSEVTILAEEEDWYKIKLNDGVGYVSKQYISDKKVEEVTSRAADSARQILNKEEEQQEEEQETKKTSSSNNSASSEGADVVSFAKNYLGYNYVSGGKNPSTGFDCSGFTSYVYKQFGVNLSGSSSGQKNAGTSVSKSDLQPGDLLIFNNSSNSSVGHVGIYIGDDEFIHAANGSKGVITTSLSSSYYEARYVDARRVLE